MPRTTFLDGRYLAIHEIHHRRANAPLTLLEHETITLSLVLARSRQISPEDPNLSEKMMVEWQGDIRSCQAR
jgi:hypothetical protein